MSLIQQALEKTRGISREISKAPGSGKILKAKVFGPLQAMDRQKVSGFLLAIGIFLGAFLGFQALGHQKDYFPVPKGKPGTHAPLKITGPMVSGYVFSPAPPPLTLSGITEIGGEYFALINNDVVSKGDSVGKAVVKEITAKKVVLSSGSRVFSLSL